MLQNYLAWNAIKPYISEVFLKDLMDPKLTNLSEDDEPWRPCVETITTAMGYAAGAMYIRRVMGDGTSKLAESTELAKLMLASVKEAFKHNLKHLDWIDRKTRVAVKEKVDMMSDIVGIKT